MPARKPPLSPAERELVREIYRQPGQLDKPKGTGLEAAAHAVSMGRWKAAGAVSTAKRKELQVSARWLARELQKPGNAANPATVDAPSETAPTSETRQPEDGAGQTGSRTGYDPPGGPA